MARSYRVQIVKELPRLLCLDNELLSPSIKAEHQAVNLNNFSDPNSSEQCVVLFALEKIVGMPQPNNYVVNVSLKFVSFK